MAGSAFQRLYTKIFKRHDIRMKTKLRVYNTFIIPVLIYGAESWAMTQTMEKELDAFENKMIRRILRISYKEHVTTEEVRCRTGQMKVSDVIKKRRMKWAGHMMRMDEARTARRAWKCQPEGRRSRGRPKTRWSDCLHQDLLEAGLSIHGKTKRRARLSLEEIASDRDKWRQVIEASLAGNS